MRPADLGAELPVISRRMSRSMRDGSHVFTQYRQMLISKGAGREPRVISVPTARDRVVLRVLANVLLELFPQARGSLPHLKVGQVREAVASAAWDSFVRVDVRDFYGAIPHGVIDRSIRARVPQGPINALLAAAIATPTVPDGAPKSTGRNVLGVPQGLSISNVVAEIVASVVDAQFANRAELMYFRFVDDVLILCNSAQTRGLFDEVQGAFSSIGLDVHPLDVPHSKSSMGRIADSFDYLGYVFDGQSVSVRPASVRKVESNIARVFATYKRDLASGDPDGTARARCMWRLNLIITGCVYERKRLGWVRYFQQMDDLTLLKRLDLTVDRLEKRFMSSATAGRKKFVRTYWALARTDRTQYIPDFDAADSARMRQTLSQVFGIAGASTMTDPEVRTRFFDIVRKEVDRLEVDVARFS